MASSDTEESKSNSEEIEKSKEAEDVHNRIVYYQDFDCDCKDYASKKKYYCENMVTLRYPTPENYVLETSNAPRDHFHCWYFQLYFF